MRRIRFTQYERILSEDLNNISNAIYDSVLDRIVGNLVKGSTGCILGDGLVITQSSVTSLGVTAGEVLYKRSSVPIGESAYTLIGTQATATVSVPVAHATLPRIDTLVLVPDDATQESYTRDVRIGGSNTVSSATVDKITEYIGTLLLVVGTPNASPVAPSAPAGTLKIAEVYVTPAVGVVNTAAITPTLQKWELINATNPTLQSLSVAGAISCNTLGATAGIATPDLDATTLGGTLDIGDTNASTLNLGTKAGSQINVGSPTSTIVLDGLVTTINTTNLDVEDKLIRANKGGLAASGGESGLEIEEDGSATAYVKTNTGRTGWEIKAPTKGVVEIEGAASAKTTLVATSTVDRVINLPDAAGTLIGTGDIGTVTSVMIANETIVDGDISPSAAIAGSKIAPASASVSGVVTTGTQTLAGAKTFSGITTISSTTASTSSTTGALVVSGGVGVAGNINTAGGSLNVGLNRAGSGLAALSLIAQAGGTGADSSLSRTSGANGNLTITNSGTGSISIVNSAGTGTGDGVQVQGLRTSAVLNVFPGPGYGAAAGFVGEILESSWATTTGYTADTTVNLGSVTLTPGLWYVLVTMVTSNNGTASGTGEVSCSPSLSPLTLEGAWRVNKLALAGATDNTFTQSMAVIGVTSNTPCYGVGYIRRNSGTVQILGNNTLSRGSKIVAFRTA
jgi:hypothetical protein